MCLDKMVQAFTYEIVNQKEEKLMKLQRPPLIGELPNKICKRITNVFCVQHGYNGGTKIPNGIRGFLLYGPPGTGKSTIARAVVYDTIVRNKQEHHPDEHLYSFINLADLARCRYGETEDIIRASFTNAMDISRKNGGFFTVIMDDVDGIFPSRSYHKLDAWYIGHLNVLFAELDQLETDKVGVIMTTNRSDLLDDAVLNRLVQIEVPYITIETARLKVQERMQDLKMDPEYADIIIGRVQERMDKGEIKNLSFREVEREIIFAFLEWTEQKSNIKIA